MKRKAKVKSGKGRTAASKLKTKRIVKGKTRLKKAASARKTAGSKRKKAPAVRARAKSVTMPGRRIVRIMGQGQYTVDSKTLKKLNDIDNAIVELVSRERSDDFEFKKRLTELNQVVTKQGKPLNPHEIIQSDIILPSADLSVDEAKKLFHGEGVIPEL
jgi:hypothetical protein